MARLLTARDTASSWRSSSSTSWWWCRTVDTVDGEGGSLDVVGSVDVVGATIVVVVRRGRGRGGRAGRRCRRLRRWRGWRRDERRAEELQPVALRVGPRVAEHVAGVLRHADDEGAIAEPRHQVGVVGVHQRVAATRRQATSRHGRPRPPRLLGDIDSELLGPVPVDLGDGDPLPTEVARLHRVLGVVAGEERHGGVRLGGHPVAVRYSGAASKRPLGTRASDIAVAEHGQLW